jgi:PncC family amidohydrolase
MSALSNISCQVVLRLTELGKKISTAESCTGGLIASSITDIPGASKVYIGSFIVYSSELKRKILGISDEVFKFGVISSEMAKAMAFSSRFLTGSDYSIATTGNLGPETMENKPAGLIYIAIATNTEVYLRELKLSGERNSNKQNTVLEALNMLLEIIS